MRKGSWCNLMQTSKPAKEYLGDKQWCLLIYQRNLITQKSTYLALVLFEIKLCSKIQQIIQLQASNSCCHLQSGQGSAHQALSCMGSISHKADKRHCPWLHALHQQAWCSWCTSCMPATRVAGPPQWHRSVPWMCSLLWQFVVHHVRSN